MKYITIEELENRKKILSDRRKEFEKEYEKNKDTEILSASLNGSWIREIDCAIGEINFLIDYCNMKEDSSFKATNCVDCKKFGKCKVRENTLVWGFGHCGLFEQKESK